MGKKFWKEEDRVLIDDEIRRLIKLGIKIMGSRRQLGFLLGYRGRWAGTHITAMLRGKIKSIKRSGLERLKEVIEKAYALEGY